MVAASIYVNPTQFGPKEDFQKYPRTLEADGALCERAGVSVVFAPTDAEMYPGGAAAVSTWVEESQVARRLEGERRPGHFRGVCTVVAKLFNIVQPDTAFFGRKDYQQLKVIQRMVRDLRYPLEIVPVATVRELVAYAKANPNALNYASGTVGSTNHLAAELFKALAGVPIARIGYKGSGYAVNDLIGGQVQLMFATSGSIAPHVKSGRLRALAVTSAQPSALAPGLPTIAASVPGYEAVTLYGLYAPAKTPAAIIERLQREAARYLQTPVISDRLSGAGVEAVGDAPAAFAAAIRADIARLSKVIKDAGIHAE